MDSGRRTWSDCTGGPLPVSPLIEPTTHVLALMADTYRKVQAMLK